MQMHTDQQLAGRLRRGDHAAVGELDQTYRGRIYQLALSYMKNPWDAEEVTQDVLLRVVRKIGTFRGEAALFSWIHRITFNTAMSRRRRAARGRLVEAPAAGREAPEDDGAPPLQQDPPDRSPLADDHVFRAQLRRRLARVLARMPSIYRVPILLRDIQGLSTGEASAVLRVKPETFKSRLRRGRLALRAQLADFAGGLCPRGSAAWP